MKMEKERERERETAGERGERGSEILSPLTHHTFKDISTNCTPSPRFACVMQMRPN